MTNKLSPCIEHTQSGVGGGYGKTSYLDQQGKRRNIYLHRKAYAIAHGLAFEDLAGLTIRHKCDNPKCYNPEHLEQGTQADNVADTVSRGRVVSGANHHKASLTVEDVQALRRAYSAGVSLAALAKRFNVSTTTAHKAATKQTYKNIK